MAGLDSRIDSRREGVPAFAGARYYPAMSRRTQCRTLAAAIMMALAPPAGAEAALDVVARWTVHYEQHYRMPDQLLWAIAVTETGRAGAPWPWTLNIAGQGQYFADRAAAAAVLMRTPGDAVDVGALQISLRFHAKRFRSRVDALDPKQNIGIAAAYLAELREIGGSWTEAVGRYHGGGPARRHRYVCKVYAVMAVLHGRPERARPGECARPSSKPKAKKTNRPGAPAPRPAKPVAPSGRS